MRVVCEEEEVGAGPTSPAQAHRGSAPCTCFQRAVHGMLQNEHCRLLPNIWQGKKTKAKPDSCPTFPGLFTRWPRTNTMQWGSTRKFPKTICSAQSHLAEKGFQICHWANYFPRRTKQRGTSSLLCSAAWVDIAAPVQ